MNQVLVSAAELDGVMETVRSSGLLVSVCTIQEPSGTFGPSGAPDGIWEDVSGLEDLPCMMAPIGLLSGGIRGTEMKVPSEILTKQPHHVLFGRYHPTIRTDMQAVIDGTEYDIESIEHDSQHRMTRLLVTRNTI